MRQFAHDSYDLCHLHSDLYSNPCVTKPPQDSGDLPGVFAGGCRSGPCGLSGMAKCGSRLTWRRTRLPLRRNIRDGSAAPTKSEGDRITIGDPLLSLTDSQLMRDIQLQKDEVARNEIQLNQCLAEADLDLQWRTNDLDDKIIDYQCGRRGT